VASGAKYSDIIKFRWVAVTTGVIHNVFCPESAPLSRGWTPGLPAIIAVVFRKFTVSSSL
jgi:hypothetical protein